MLFHEQPSDPWVPFDFMLLEAFQILQDETCGDCGNPIWICRNENAANVGFKVKTSTCFARAELDRWREKEEKKKSSKKAYGQNPYIVAYTYDDGPMPTRAGYYSYMADKAQDRIE
jgi:hypothetical protein